MGFSVQPMHSTSLSPASAAQGRDARKKRDRHGRSLRHGMLPIELPGYMSPSSRFDMLLLASAERLETLWGDQVSTIQFTVEDVPAKYQLKQGHNAPLGAAFPAQKQSADVGAAGGSDALVPPLSAERIVLYRLLFPRRFEFVDSLAALVHDVVVEQFALLRGMEPQEVDVRYRSPEERF